MPFIKFSRIILASWGIFLVIGTIPLRAQTLTPVSISPGGGFFSNNSNSLSFTISELMISTYPSGNNYWTQGFQQPEPSVIISIKESNPFLSNIKIYPNPFSTQLNLSISTPENNDYSIQIYDINGRMVKPPLLLAQGFGNQVYALDVNELPSGIYILRILEQDGTKHTDLKIIRM